MKKAILIGMVSVLVLFLLPSCAAGVSQEELERASSELAAAQAEIQSLQSELSAKESELAAAQTEIQSLQSESSAKESEVEAIKDKLEQGKARVEILNVIFIPAVKGELDKMTEAEIMNLFFECRDKIKDIDDPTLSTKFEAMIGASGAEAMNSFFLYLVESTADALK